MRTTNRLILFLTATFFTVASVNVVAQEKKAGVIDKTGNFVVFPQYDEIWDFEEGFAIVAKNDKYGFIDKTGREVVPPRYDRANFHQGLVKVVKDGKYGFIDRNGDILFWIKYDEVQKDLDLELLESYEGEPLRKDLNLELLESYEGEPLRTKVSCNILGYHDGEALVEIEIDYHVYVGDYLSSEARYYIIDKTRNMVVPLEL